jgi:hypothetical protein
MTYSNFLRTMLTYQKISKDISELADIGIDFLEGKYRLSELTYSLFLSTFESHYTKGGIEWIDWFMFDANWGLKDFTNNDIPTFQINDDGETEVIEPDGEVKWGAIDSDGNPVAYSFESLWELLEKDYKL